MAREEYTSWVGALLRIAEGLPSGMGLQYAPSMFYVKFCLAAKFGRPQQEKEPSISGPPPQSHRGGCKNSSDKSEKCTSLEPLL